jgi:hypothetical protein
MRISYSLGHSLGHSLGEEEDAVFAFHLAPKINED